MIEGAKLRTGNASMGPKYDDQYKVRATPYADLRNPISVDEQGSYAEYLVRDPDRLPELGLNTHLLITDERNGQTVWIDATVVGIRAVTPFNPERQHQLFIEDDDTNPYLPLEDLQGPHTLQRYLIRLRLNLELGADKAADTFSISAVHRPPSSISYATFPKLLPPEDGRIEPSLADMLSIRKRGVVLGAVGFGNEPYEEEGRFLKYRLDLNALDNKHMFIVGESGSGKTVLLKNLALAFKTGNRRDTRVIITDVQGDMLQLVLSEFSEIVERRDWQRRFDDELPEQPLEALKPLTLVLPVSGDDNAGVTTAAVKILAERAGIRIREIGLRLQDLSRPSDVEYLFRVASDQAAMLLDEAAEGLVNRGKPASIANLRQAIANAKNRGPGNTFVSTGGTEYYKSTADAALRALVSLNQFFDRHQLSMESENNPLACLDTDGTTIFFLEHLAPEERIMWEMQLVQWLYENKRLPQDYFVFVDEAHQLIPAKPPEAGARGTFERLRSNFEKLAREGRKFGVHLILGTQSPTDLHPIVPQQCPSRIVMKIDPKNAQATDLSKEAAAVAVRFSHGQFWFRNAFNGSPDWVRIHSPATRLPHESMSTFWPKILKGAENA